MRGVGVQLEEAGVKALAAVIAVQTEEQMIVLKGREVKALSKMVKGERVEAKVQKVIQERVMKEFKS